MGKGEGNSVNYKYRMHDPRIGRFFAVDPLAPKYPHYTPYQFSGNKVIAFVELEGLEEGQSEAGSMELNMGADFDIEGVDRPHENDIAYNAGISLWQNLESNGVAPSDFSQYVKKVFNQGSPSAQLTDQGVNLLGNVSQYKLNAFINLLGIYNNLKAGNEGESGAFLSGIRLHNTYNNSAGLYNDIVPFANRANMLHKGNLGLAVTAVGGAIMGSMARVSGVSRLQSGVDLSSYSRGLTNEFEEITLYRSMGLNEAKSLISRRAFSIGPNSYAGKQFWIGKKGLDFFKVRGFANDATVSITVRRSALRLGQNYPRLIIDGQSGITLSNSTTLNTFNNSILRYNYLRYGGY